MFEVYAFLIMCTLLAGYVDQYTYQRVSDGFETNRIEDSGKYLFVLLIAIFIWFSGTRTVMNDTATYINTFNRFVSTGLFSITNINWSIGANPLFEIYLILIKTFISQDGQVMILITSIIVALSMVSFLQLYSWDFGESIYFFIATTSFAFTMAAMKQTLATAIGIWAIPLMLKNKNIQAVAVILAAMLFHPYVVVFLISFVFKGKKAWDSQIYILVLITVLLCISFSTFVEQVLHFTEIMGDEYSINWFTEGTGSSIYRVLSSMILPGFAFLYRRELQEENNPILDICVNMSLVSACISLISGVGGTILIGRVPSYFGIFRCLAFPYVMYQGTKVRNGDKNPWNTIVQLAFLLYYTAYYRKYFISSKVGMWGSVYKRTSILNILFGGNG